MSNILWPAAILAAVAASPLRPVSMREMGLVLVGILLAVVWNRSKRDRVVPRRPRASINSPSDDDEYSIDTIDKLRAILPAGLGGSRLDDAKKVIDYIDDQMVVFIAQSPLLYLATYDAVAGMPFLSPKGDEPGFCRVVESKNKANNKHHTLVIPDRPGNRLLFGLQNIIGEGTTVGTTGTTTAKASVLFEVPGCGSTLRVGGTARLSRDPSLLQKSAARGCTPKIVLLVDVEHAFFHCAKAYMRSRVWDPESWPSPSPAVKFGRYFAKEGGALANRIDCDVDRHYRQVQKAVDGEACELHE